MSIELVQKFAPFTDELFKAESKLSMLTNTDFDWTGAHSVKVWKISTAALNNYKRNISEENDETLSRFGAITDLNAQTEEMLLKNDRSFIFNVDKLDADETAQQVEAGKALARELREVVVPEIDTYVYAVMTENAGSKTANELNKTNIYTSILAGSEVLDNAEVPDTERVLVVTPAVYTMLKQAVEFDNTDVGANLREKGAICTLDGMTVVKVPASRLPKNFGFMIAHPSATVAPLKLEDYGIHPDTVISSGTIVTGRIVYDAFVLDNKKAGIYYHAISEAAQNTEK